MRKNIFIVRHCEAQGQSVDAQLTETGRQQAIDLSGFFANMKIDRIISSPFQRAVASVKPLSEKINIHIEADEQIGRASCRERVERRDAAGAVWRVREVT